jgi:imidazolonepropionase-like amidohydrolase
MNSKYLPLTLLFIYLSVPASSTRAQDLVIYGDVIYPVSQPAIENGVVVVRGGKIAAVGPANAVPVPEGVRSLRAAVVTPGLIDAHSVVGLTGILNQDEDQDQLDRTEPIQPQLRAIDAYNPRDELVEWIRSFGVTTVHTGHAPGELVSGQTMIIKTTGDDVDASVLIPFRAITVTLASSAQKSGTSSPGTRGKMIAMLRENLLKAQEYSEKLKKSAESEASKPDRDLKLESFVSVLEGKTKLLVTADRSQDIASALRLAKEFKLKIWIDSGAESYLLIDEILEAGASVIIHPSMARAVSDRENMSFETAAKLHEAGIPLAFQSGFEPYVPKTRVVLFEAALAAAHGLGFEKTLKALTLDSATLLGIQDRVGSLEAGKDADIALYDGDPLEYTSHCVGVVIDGKVVSEIHR